MPVQRRNTRWNKRGSDKPRQMIIADTGFFVAFVVRSDRHHARALMAAKRYADQGLVTT